LQPTRARGDRGSWVYRILTNLRLDPYERTGIRLFASKAQCCGQKIKRAPKKDTKLRDTG